jgi:hypothetical protein
MPEKYSRLPDIILNPKDVKDAGSLLHYDLFFKELVDKVIKCWVQLRLQGEI